MEKMISIEPQTDNKLIFAKILAFVCKIVIIFLCHDQTDLQYQDRGCATVRSSELLVKLELENLKLISRERLPWFRHVERSNGAVRPACDIQIEGRRGAGRPKLTWKKLTEKDCR